MPRRPVEGGACVSGPGPAMRAAIHASGVSRLSGETFIVL